MAVDGCPGTWAHAALTPLQYHLAALELDIKDVGGIICYELAALRVICLNELRQRFFSTPMAYDSCTCARWLSPLFSMDLAICRQRYAEDRSTFVGSMPDKAQPPCAPQTLYVSIMVLRPVRPAFP